MIALPENAMEPTSASARPGQIAGAAEAAAGTGSAAMVVERIAWHSRDRSLRASPARRHPHCPCR